MSGMVGNDPVAMEHLARRMQSEADALDQAISQVARELQGLSWDGSNRDRFEAEWRSTHVRGLRRVAESLRTSASTVRRDAAEQRHVSDR
jgi:uncharacterized protein YukE